MFYQFKQDFLWGAACSGPQTEGSNGKNSSSIWEYDFGKNPEKFFDQVGNLTASNFYHDYKNYIENMKQAGVTSLRFSIQWTRLFDDCNQTKNQEGIQFYHDVIDALIANEIQPMVCLFHFDTPMCYMERGGFENRATVDAFVEFAKLCFAEYGSKVHYWSTFNEPVVVAEQGYLYEAHYPDVVDMKRAVQVAYHLQLASSKAVAAFKELKCSGEIGVILNLTPSYAPENATRADENACNIMDLLFNRSFLDPSVLGKYPQELIDLLKKENCIPAYESKDLMIIRDNIVDYLGVNYYTPRRVKARVTPYQQTYLMPEKYYESYTFDGQKMNPYRGWEIYERALFDIGENLRKNYGNIKWYVSENGMGVESEDRFMGDDGVVQDDYRIEFIQEHLKYLHKAIAAGSNCFGYHLWTPFDNWSWRNAYKNRYGLIRVDIKDGCKQTIKKSGHWFCALAQNNGFSDEA